MQLNKNLRDLPDEQLMILSAKGNEPAFEEIYNRYHDKLFGFFCKMLKYNQEKARDLLHDLFMKVIEKPEYFDPSRKFSTWIFTIAANMVKNEYRNNSNRNRLLEENREEVSPASEFPDEFIYDRKLFARYLDRAIDELDLKKREAFILRFREELSIKEISVILNLPEGTVKSRIFYSLRELGNKLEIFSPKKHIA